MKGMTTRPLLRVALLLAPGLLLESGCLYMPPAPTAIWPLAEGETELSLHLTADLLYSERAPSPLAAMGFYPCLRYALSCDQEMVFFPWPAYRHWGGLRERGHLHYHQVSLGKLAPIESFVRRGAARSLLGDLGTEYLRYDFRRLSGASTDACWASLSPEADDPNRVRFDELAGRRRDFVGVAASLHGRMGWMRPAGALEIELGAVLGRSSGRFGVACEPSLITLALLRGATRRGSGEEPGMPTAGPPAPRERWWLRHARLALWGGE